METEATDVFGSEIGGDDDPFAGTEFGDFEQPAAEPEPEPRPVPEAVAPPAADIPIVDKEGEIVSPPTPPSAAPSEPTGPTTQSEAPVPSSAPPVGPGTSAEPVPAPAAPPATAQAATAPPATKTPPPGIAPEAQAAMDALKKPTPAAPPSSGGPEPSSTQPEPPPTPISPPSAAPADSPAGSTDTGEAPTSPAPSSQPISTATGVDDTQAKLRAIAEREQAERSRAELADPTPPVESAGLTEPVVPEPIRPPLEGDALAAAVAPPVQPDESPADGDGIESPEELKDKKGRVTHRRYLILQPDGSGKYTEVHWHVDKDGRMVAAGTKGAKKQKHALSRGQEDALKIGYAAVGAPPRVTLIAVAESQFQPKTIEPEAPRPERARLKIR